MSAFRGTVFSLAHLLNSVTLIHELTFTYKNESSVRNEYSFATGPLTSTWPDVGVDWPVWASLNPFIEMETKVRAWVILELSVEFFGSRLDFGLDVDVVCDSRPSVCKLSSWCSGPLFEHLSKDLDRKVEKIRPLNCWTFKLRFNRQLCGRRGQTESCG